MVLIYKNAPETGAVQPGLSPVFEKRLPSPEIIRKMETVFHTQQNGHRAYALILYFTHLLRMCRLTGLGGGDVEVV